MTTFPARWTPDNSEGFTADDLATLNEAQAYLEARFPAIDGGNIADLLNNEFRADLDARQLERAVARRIETPMTAAAAFLAQNPTKLGSFCGYNLWEHPKRGDTDAIYMTTPDGRLINTGFYDMGDFDYALCEEIAAGNGGL